METGQNTSGIIEYMGQSSEGQKDILDGKHYLVSKNCQSEGEWAKVITGIGAGNFVNPYVSTSKSLWIKLSVEVGFRLDGGPDLGSLMINIGDILKSPEKILLMKKIAAGLLYFAGLKDASQREYKESYAFSDFGLKITEVILLYISYIRK